jgi:hypothetical protein
VIPLGGAPAEEGDDGAAGEGEDGAAEEAADGAAKEGEVGAAVEGVDGVGAEVGTDAQEGPAVEGEEGAAAEEGEEGAAVGPGPEYGPETVMRGHPLAEGRTLFDLTPSQRLDLMYVLCENRLEAEECLDELLAMAAVEAGAYTRPLFSST